MQIVHGTWLPDDTDAFVQRGGFYVWVETDTPATSRPGRAPGSEHPRHLNGPDLARFLHEKLGFERAGYGDEGTGRLGRLIEKTYLLLPSAAGRPLPSFELAPYVEDELPDAYDLIPWKVASYRLQSVISDLNQIQYVAQTAADEFQLGADLQFWQQHAQAIKGIIARDQYIPSLAYRVPEPGKETPRTAGHSQGRPYQAREPQARGRQPGSAEAVSFEIHAGWEIVSADYEALIKRHAAAMPLVCTAGLASPANPSLYSPEPLLRHFSECVLHDAVTGTSFPDAFQRQIADSILLACLHEGVRRPLSYRGQNPFTVLDERTPEAALEEYEQWLTWKTALTRAHTDAGFTLCFRLEEAAATDADNWRLHFLVAARDDPSRRLSLAEYWDLKPKARAEAARPFGADFEQRLLLALGAAARIYPTIWDGLATDQPTGCHLTLDGAFTFLRESAWVLEDAGFTVVVPAWWTPQGRRRARVRLKTAARPSTGSTAVGSGRLSMESLISYQYQLSVGGQVVSEQEWQQLVDAKTPLVQFRGQWIELDRENMQEMLQFWQSHQQESPELDLLDLLKLGAEADGDVEWDHDQAVEEMLDRLQDKSAFAPIEDPAALQATLRDYQRRGVAWLHYLESLGLNPCLADDMGLGKTIQVISRLLMEREAGAEVPPTLIIAPTSVLGNWRREIERFAPELRSLVHQGSTREKSEKAFVAAAGQHDVVLTSFTLARMDEKLLRGVTWHRVVVDEAQNIKNPSAAQTKAILKLSAPHRLALTGTPVENRLRDLWSIFNFLSPGYLGKEAQFRKSFEIPIYKGQDPTRSVTLKKLAEPFILRRLKTDKRIIDDLPDKIEQKLYTTLSSEQASLYEAVVKDVERQIAEVDGMERRGLILATLMRLKQICNHPAQFLADGSPFTPERSHKLARLGEMVEELIEAGDSALIFTQFTEIGDSLERYLGHTRHIPTHYLHGGTSAARREKMVAEFQDPESPPAVFILSLKAGGVGLNLTRANHVFHFDRWWNPAVEDQATDRAFRIGQRKNVFVHKFVALGTMEEKIDAMIEDKKKLSSLVVGTDEGWLTELDNETFKSLIALRKSAVLD
jgi:SNF2 family DNA or RNA helicase